MQISYLRRLSAFTATRIFKAAALVWLQFRESSESTVDGFGRRPRRESGPPFISQSRPKCLASRRILTNRRPQCKVVGIGRTGRLASPFLVSGVAIAQAGKVEAPRGSCPPAPSRELEKLPTKLRQDDDLTFHAQIIV